MKLVKRKNLALNSLFLISLFVQILFLKIGLMNKLIVKLDSIF